MAPPPSRNLGRQQSYVSYRARRPGSMKAQYEAVDESTEGCARVCQLLLVVVVSSATTFGVLAILNCEFLIYFKPLNLLENSTALLDNTTDTMTSSVTQEPLTPSMASFGLFFYKEDVASEYCYAYDFQSFSDKPLDLKIAQWGCSLAAAFGIVAMFLLLVEICCCRFPCSRVLVHMSFFAGALFTVPIFVLFANENCNLLNSNAYSCQLGHGAFQAMTTAALFLVSMCFSCMTPTTRPVFRVIQEREQRSEHDPCPCTCGCFRCCGERTRDDIYLKNPELLLAELPHEDVEVGGGNGGERRIYKHYYDDLLGGATLQSQYAAASQRWLNSERDYQTMLDRFKQECLDLQSSMTNNSSSPASGSSRRKLDEYFDDEDKYSAREILQNSDWRVLLAIPPERISDAELGRLAQVLCTMRENCRQAKEIMDRIEIDLEEHIKPQDEKMKAALREIEEKKNAGRNAKHGKVASKKPQREEEVQDTHSDTERHANLKGDYPRGYEDDPSSDERLEVGQSDDTNDQIRAPASMEADVFSSVVAPADADLRFENQYFMDAEQPPVGNTNKTGSSWLSLRIWGDPQGDVKKTS